MLDTPNPPFLDSGFLSGVATQMRIGLPPTSTTSHCDFGVLPLFSNDYDGATPSATGTAFGWGFLYRRTVYRQRAIRKENEYADLEA